MTSSTPCFWPFDFKQTLASVTTALFVGRSLEKKQGSSRILRLAAGLVCLLSMA
jgi:hypothetical protein